MNPIPEIEWLVDAAPKIIAMIPVAGAEDIAALVTVAGQILKAAVEMATADDFDAGAAVRAADAAAELALSLKFPHKAKP